MIYFIAEVEYERMGQMDGSDAWWWSRICLWSSIERISGIQWTRTRSLPKTHFLLFAVCTFRVGIKSYNIANWRKLYVDCCYDIYIVYIYIYIYILNCRHYVKLTIWMRKSKIFNVKYRCLCFTKITLFTWIITSYNHSLN